ncbi:MAG: hypothetical protein HN975_15970 [Anaerolineae bacterium]|jgi:hypothetical protein|nr:hypothetical protein [Anaerolineae bacterium]
MIQLPDDVKAINPNPEADGIQLPFVAPVFWWKNGDKRMSHDNGVQYFGGWEGNEDDIRDAMIENGELPEDFVLDSRMGNEGAYSVYSRRSLTVVPIKARKRWVDSRSHSQTLCLLGLPKEGGGFKVWGTIVLTAKGYATDRLSEAIKAWTVHTKPMRLEHAPNVPSWYFWQALGTSGEFVEESVGKSIKSNITPISAFLPKMNKELLEKVYVGNDLARKISELEEQAKEWATDKRWLKNETEETAPIAQTPVTAETMDAEMDVDAAFP